MYYKSVSLPQNWRFKLFSHCEKSLSILPVDGECHEVCDCIFVKVHRNLWVMMWYFASVLCVSINFIPCLYFMFEAMWCLSAGTGRLTFTQWVQKKRTWVPAILCQLSFTNPIPIISPIPPSLHCIASHLHLFTLLLSAEIHSETARSQLRVHVPYYI